MVPAHRAPDAHAVSRTLSGLAVGLAGLAAVSLLFPQPLADAFFAGWVLAGVGLAAVGAYGAWTCRSALVWVAALLLAGLSVVGMWSIGLFIAPAALALLGAAVTTRWVGSRSGAREAVRAEPSSVLEVGLKTLGGITAVLLGAWLVYEGTIVRELFTRGCASETLACALTVTRWEAVGLSVIGFAVVGLGSWLVWRQVAIGRALASNHPG